VVIVMGDEVMVMGDTVGLRERKKLKTREALEHAALELFAEKGFDHTTIEEIVEACEMSPRTFFRYFPNKEAVLLGDSDDRCAELVSVLLARPATEGPLEAIRESVLPNLSSVEQDRERMLLMARVMAETPSLRIYKIEHQQGWEDAILEALRARDESSSASPRSVLELRLIASASIAALRAAVETWLEDGGDLMALVRTAFDNIAAGLADV
jgi:AcrR family transcriptional regulator